MFSEDNRQEMQTRARTTAQTRELEASRLESAPEVQQPTELESAAGYAMCRRQTSQRRRPRHRRWSDTQRRQPPSQMMTRVLPLPSATTTTASGSAVGVRPLCLNLSGQATYVPQGVPMQAAVYLCRSLRKHSLHK
jgi:hypothetical protein